MNKQITIAASIIILLLILATIVEQARPKPINWEPTFSRFDKIPYGTKVLHDILPTVFSPGTVTDFSDTPYELYQRYQDTMSCVYISVCENFRADSLDTESLRYFAMQGNTVFIAAQNFSSVFERLVGFRTDYSYGGMSDTVRIEHFVSPHLGAKKPFTLKRTYLQSYFDSVDASTTTIIAVDSNNYPTLIRISVGDGEFLLSTNPLAFTNYTLMHPYNYGYVERALSVIPEDNHTVFWDDYFSIGRLESPSPFRAWLQNPALKYVLWLGILTTLLYLFLYGRRRQRIIPVISSPPNMTLEFTRTVGSLYFEHGNHKNLAEKKILHFLEFIRTRFYLRTNELDQQFIVQLAERSRMEVSQLSQLFAHIRSIRSAPTISEESLVALCTSIDKVYQHCGE